MSLSIKVNGTRVYFDEDKLAQDDVAYERGSDGEQCEDCGHDIAENGKLIRAKFTRDIGAGSAIRCTNCGATYPLVEG